MPDIEIQLPHKFTWRGYQKALFIAYDKGINRLFLVWHRRAGKDKACLNFMVCRAMERVGSYYYLLPTYTQVKKIIWDGMDAGGFKFMDHIPASLIVRKNESELKVELINGSIIQLLGTDNIDRIVGVNPVGVVFSEYSLQDPRAYDFYRPILNENKGWALFNGTPRGSGEHHFYKLYKSIENDPSWYHSLLTIDDTRKDAPGEDGGPVVTPAMLDQDRSEGMDEDLLQQEYYCNFSGSKTGSYYGALMVKLEEDGRFCDVPWNPRLPVFTAWDLGIADAMTVIFCQNDGQMINIIDYIEKRGEGLGYFSAEINRKSYVYSNHYAPHDITSRELTSGKTRLELARDLGLDFRIAPNIAIQDGIDSLRSLFPRLRIDRSKCSRLADCLRSYHKLYDPKNKEYGKTPVHDWSSHGADAARYMSLVYDLEYESRHIETKAVGMADSVWNNPDDEEAENVL